MEFLTSAGLLSEKQKDKTPFVNAFSPWQELSPKLFLSTTWKLKQAGDQSQETILQADTLLWGLREFN